jgi:hypothetical protein
VPSKHEHAICWPGTHELPLTALPFIVRPHALHSNSPKIQNQLRPCIEVPPFEPEFYTSWARPEAPLRSAVVEYRFSDYIAGPSVSNIPGRRHLLCDHYMSARD